MARTTKRPSRRDRQPLNRVVGLRIRAYREAQGMARAELARRSGTALTAIVLAESGRTAMTIRSLERIARALAVRPADLVDDGEATPRAMSKTLARIHDRLSGLDERRLRLVDDLVKAAVHHTGP